MKVFLHEKYLGKLACIVKSSFIARGMTFNVENSDLWQAKEITNLGEDWSQKHQGIASTTNQGCVRICILWVERNL